MPNSQYPNANGRIAPLPLRASHPRRATASTNAGQIESVYIEDPQTSPLAHRGRGTVDDTFLDPDDTPQTRVGKRRTTMSSRGLQLYKHTPCALTNELTPVEVAHLIPISAEDNTVRIFCCSKFEICNLIELLSSTRWNLLGVCIVRH